MGIPATSAIHDRAHTVQQQNVLRYVLVIKSVAAFSILTSPFWLGVLFFTNPQEYSFASSLVCVPLIAAVSVVAVMHLAQGERYLRRLLMAGLVAHIAASSVFLWIGMFIYGGIADAFHYWTVGLQLAQQFQIVGWSAFQPPYASTNLINTICGIATLLIGDALPTLFVAFAMISLAGGYLFYRAFTVAFPDGDRWLFGLLVVLSPSILFWSSFIGKDALIQFSIALTCFGFARLTQRASLRNAILCAIGLGGTLLVRAHVAAMLAIAMTFPYAVGRSRIGGSGKAARIILVPVLAAGTYFLISQAKNFIDIESDNSTTVLQQADTITRNSQIGGSAFNEGLSLPLRIAGSPLLLFRPFPWEMRNVMSLAPAIESVGLLLICWFRRREIWFALRHWRDPYIGFLLMYTVVFLIIFGGTISNLGILLRQRIMVTPMVLMLICAMQKSPTRTASPKPRKNAWPVSKVGTQSDGIPTGA